VENNSKRKLTLSIAAVWIGLFAIVTILFVYLRIFSEPITIPVTKTVQPLPSDSNPYWQESIPLPTLQPDYLPTPAIIPTRTYLPTFTPAPFLILTPIDRPLADLIILHIGDPTCVHDDLEDNPRSYLTMPLIIRNVGLASSHSFRFEVYVLLGPKSYNLGEWADRFNGSIGSPDLFIGNLDPGKDKTFTLAIDLKGIASFGIMAVANSGSSPVLEINKSNNQAVRYFNFYCN